MFARFLCCALCALVVAPATAIDITEDTTLTADDVFGVNDKIRVQEGVTLTIDGADIPSLTNKGTVISLPGSTIRKTAFTNNATWDIRGGDFLDFENSFNGNITISGGTFHDQIKFWDGTFERGTFTVTGGTFLSSVSFSSPGEPSGDFDISISGGEWLGGGVYVKEGNATIDVFGRYFVRVYEDGFQQVRGILDNGNPFGAGAESFDESVIVIHSELPSPVPGDSNADGVVDLTDLNDTRNNFGYSGSLPVLGDANFDRVVDLEDLNLVRNNFGAVSNPVPEPSTMALGFVALAGILARCRYSMLLRRWL